MTLTLVELKEKIAEQYTEVDIIDALALTTEYIVEAFSDRIEDKREFFIKELELLDNEE